MDRKTGFTLIELLVVIAIIALLLAVIIPALNVAKKQAASAACLSNVRQLTVCYRLYADDNDDNICGPGQRTNFDSSHWAGKPKTGSGWTGGTIEGADSTGSTAEQESVGVQNGSLFPYYENPELVHCPADKRFVKPPVWDPTWGGTGGWRTYSIPHHLGLGSSSEKIEKFSQIPIPGSKFVFLEENDPRNYNWNSWRMNHQTPSLIDPFGIFHGDKGIMGFADGHADKVVWKDQDTKYHSQGLFDGSKRSFTLVDPGNVDLEWLASHYPHR